MKSLAQVNKQDQIRIHELEIEIGKIGLGQHNTELRQKRQDLKVLQNLHEWLLKTAQRLSPEMVANYNKKILQYQELTNRAKELSTEHFHHERFTQTGTELWHNFIQTAHQLAQAESQYEQSYPQKEDLCLLCQQPLSDNARQLILQLWAYLVGQVSRDLDQIEHEIDLISEEFKDTIPASRNFSTSLVLLSNEQPKLGENAKLQVESYLQIEKNILKLYSSREVMELEDALPKDCSQDINIFIQQLQTEINILDKQDLLTRSKNLEAERRLLEHRQKLKALLPEIEEYINQRIWAKQASKAGGSTRHITSEYNRLFEKLVKNNYIDIFENTLSKLGRPIQVEIVTSGRKGKTLKQIQLKAHQTAKDIADPDKVLSEGEKRAVALADFLTEAALDTTSSGIVLDDPVTSLDLEWRKTIAQILVNETENRQVVIFTHDLPFLYLLLEQAQRKNFQKDVHWIKRGDIDELPGYVYLNNCPALEKEYKSSHQAQECYSQAQKAENVEKQIALIREGMAALRTSYEALVVYEYFGGVVERFDERISLGRLPQLVWNDEISIEIDENYGRLSRYIEGHLHSDTMAHPLKPEMLRTEFETFDVLRKRIKDLKKEKEKHNK